MPEYGKIIDGKILAIISTNNDPPENCIKLPENYHMPLGTPVEHIDKATGKLLTDDELKKKGISDHRGDYWDSKGKKHRIKKFGEAPKADWIKRKPLPYEVYKKGKWEVDKKKKSDHESKNVKDKKRAEIIKLQNYLYETDWYTIRNIERPNKNVPSGILTKRQKARDDISKLRLEVSD